MFNDKLGQISLERIKKKNKQQKSRKTQSLSNFKNANSYSLDPFKRHTLNIFNIAADDVFISYENSNPENKIKRNTGFSFGNVEKEIYTAFDEMIVSKKNRVEHFKKPKEQFLNNSNTLIERKNAVVDTLKRNLEITVLDNNYPFPRENTSYAKAAIGESLKQENSTSQIVSSFYEDFDSSDPFFDEQERSIKGGVYISSKNYYNSGKVKTFVEKDNIKNNSILPTKDGNDQYYKDSKYFKTSGFVYKSKRPDSIAFGGLKK